MNWFRAITNGLLLAAAGGCLYEFFDPIVSKDARIVALWVAVGFLTICVRNFIEEGSKL